eukprot:842055-Prymnesium_polylepis.1
MRDVLPVLLAPVIVRARDGEEEAESPLRSRARDGRARPAVATVWGTVGSGVAAVTQRSATAWLVETRGGGPRGCGSLHPPDVGVENHRIAPPPEVRFVIDRLHQRLWKEVLGVLGVQ